MEAVAAKRGLKSMVGLKQRKGEDARAIYEKHSKGGKSEANKYKKPRRM